MSERDECRNSLEDEIDYLCQRIRALCQRLQEAERREGVLRRVLDDVRKEACSLRFAQPSVSTGDVRPIGERFHKIAHDALAQSPQAEESGERCPACPVEVRDLHACAHNLLNRWDDRALDSVTRHMEHLRDAVRNFQPYVDAHFSDRKHSHGEDPDTTRATTGERAPGHTDLMVAPEDIPDDLGKGDPRVDPNAPTEPTGEALAALLLDLDRITDSEAQESPEYERIRQHLQAGVPEAEQIGRAVDRAVQSYRLHHQVDDDECRTIGLVDAFTPDAHDTVNIGREECRGLIDHITNELVFALAAHDSGGQGCVWHKPDPEEEFYETACGSAWDSPDGMRLDEFPSMRYCSNCGKRIKVAAPQSERDKEQG